MNVTSQARGPAAVVAAVGTAEPRVSELDSRAAWEQAKLQLVLDKLADGTKKTYSVGWRWWALFCRARGEEPLRTVTDANLREEESLMLDFVLHLAIHGHKAVGTIKQHLNAIRTQFR